MKATIETADGEMREVEGASISEFNGSVYIWESDPKDDEGLEGIGDAFKGEGFERFEGATIISRTEE